MQRAYASRAGSGLVFLACTTCVSGRLVAKDFSCGGGAVRLSATRSPRSSRAFWRVYFRSRRKSPPSTCTDLPVPNVSHAIENQLEDDLHPPFLASSCRKATPLPFEQDQLLWPPPSHRYSSRGRPSGQRRNVIRTAPKPEYKFGTGTGRPSGQRRNVIRTAPPKRRTSSRPTGRT